MIRALAVVMLLPGLVLGGGMVLAQASGSEDVIEDDVIYQRVTRIDVTEADKIEGEVYRPDQAFFRGKRGVDFPCLVEIRQNFAPEILKSASSL